MKSNSNVSVSSEIQRLLKVIVHRPDEGIARITPKRAGELLFDDIVHLPNMQEEHDVFTDLLKYFLGKENVLETGELLLEALIADEETKYEIIEMIIKYEELGLGDLDTENYSVFGVIGGGIKSHMLYKVYPEVFPNRSRRAIWALWYLSDKKVIDCKYDSEFLMIDTQKTITQQNYFYPYEIFAFYAHRIFQMLKEKAKENNVFLDPKYRYIFVDVFMDFIAKQHDEDISFFKSQIKDGGYGGA